MNKLFIKSPESIIAHYHSLDIETCQQISEINAVGNACFSIK